MITNSDLRIGNYFKTNKNYYQVITSIGIGSCELNGKITKIENLAPIELTPKIINMIKGFNAVDTREIDYIEKLEIPKEVEKRDIDLLGNSSVCVSGCVFHDDGNITHYKKSKYKFVLSLPDFVTIHFNYKWENDEDPSLIYIVGDGFEVESTPTPVVYLHQLQNLYHSLTGEDLEVNIS